MPPIVTNLLKVTATPELIADDMVLARDTEVDPTDAITKLLNPGALKTSKELKPVVLLTKIILVPIPAVADAVVLRVVLYCVVAVDTRETIFTSIELFELVASVVTPVIIPFKNPLKVDVVPAPGTTTPFNEVVTPIPTDIPNPARFVVLMPIV